jgi:hypothetical protein
LHDSPGAAGDVDDELVRRTAADIGRSDVAGGAQGGHSLLVWGSQLGDGHATLYARNGPIGSQRWTRASETGEHEPVTDNGGAPKSLPLILARELAANLATPMFLIDGRGMLVYYNDAAALLLGKSFAEVGEITGNEFGERLEMATPEGEPIRRRDAPAGIAFIERRPAHRTLLAKMFDERRLRVHATAYPLFATAEEMHGVVGVFWESSTRESDA